MQDFSENSQKALAKLQDAADELWHLVDGHSLSFVIRVEDSVDPIEAFKQLRNVQATSPNACNVLRSFMQPWDVKTDAFSEKIESFKLEIERSARNRGLRRLPDEVLVEILDRAADSLESSVRLSHVCKRFRRTLIWASKYWTGQTLTAKRPPWTILSIIERTGDGRLRAEIEFCDKVGPTSDSVKAILDLGARLDYLWITSWRPDIPPLTYPEEGHALSPRTLICEKIVPHPSLSKNLVRYRLVMNEISLKHLLRFLSSASKLEELHLDISDLRVDRDDADACGPISLPSLTSLSVSPAWAVSTESSTISRILPWMASPRKFRADNLRLLQFFSVRGEDFGRYASELAGCLVRRG